MNVSSQTIFIFFERREKCIASFITILEKKKEFQVSLVTGSRVSLPPSSFNVVTNRGENWPGFRGHVITAYDSRWHTRLFGKNLAKKNAGNSGNVGHHGFPKYGGAIIIGRTHDL